MATKKNQSFEAAMARLEEIARSLESGAEGLDSMLKLYGEGVELIRLCAERLDTAEQNVKMLKIGEDGSVNVTAFPVDGGEKA